MEFKKSVTHYVPQQTSELQVSEFDKHIGVMVSVPNPTISIFRLTVDEEEELRRILNARHLKRIQDTLPGE